MSDEVSFDTGDVPFDDSCQEILAKCVDTLKRKGHDYARDRSRLDNFERAAAGLGLRPSAILAVYAFKHWTAIERYCADGKVQSEDIEGRIMDMINYMLLLRYMIKRDGEGKP